MNRLIVGKDVTNQAGLDVLFNDQATNGEVGTDGAVVRALRSSVAAFGKASRASSLVEEDVLLLNSIPEDESVSSNF